MFKIDIHTHIVPSNLNDITNTFSDSRFIKLKNFSNKEIDMFSNDKFFRKIKCNCWDHKIRIDEMNSYKVDMQVLSTIPVLFSYWSEIKDAVILSEFINNHISEIVHQYPERYFGLGTIPMQNTDSAIYEMDRCINDLNLHGIQIGTNVNDENLSENKFIPIFEHAEKINCPIFVHPWEVLGEKKIQKYWLPWLVGMPAEISRAICSLIFGGILEKFPKLRIAFAHGGGSFPYTIGRIDKGFTARPDLCAIDNNILPSKYLKSFYVDSLTHNKNTLNYLIDILGYDKILFGTDYPFPLGETEPGELINSLNISIQNKQRLFAGSALEWLGLDEKKYF